MMMQPTSAKRFGCIWERIQNASEILLKFPNSSRMPPTAPQNPPRMHPKPPPEVLQSAPELFRRFPAESAPKFWPRTLPEPARNAEQPEPFGGSSGITPFCECMQVEQLPEVEPITHCAWCCPVRALALLELRGPRGMEGLPCIGACMAPLIARRAGHKCAIELLS